MKVVIVDASKSYVDMITSMGNEVITCNLNDNLHLIDFKTVDVVLFTGGADVTPEIYGHTKHPKSFCSPLIDDLCINVYNEAIKHKHIKFVGICRGSQFLCVMSGGKLFQDLRGHAIQGTHVVATKWGSYYDVTSTHHQMQDPRNVNHVNVAWGKEIAYNVVQHIDGKEVPVELDIDYEVVWYPDTNCLGFQPHPEFNGYKSCRDLFIRCWNEYIK